MYLKLNGIEIKCEGSERWGDLLDRLPDGGAGALGITVQGRTDSLNDAVEEYADNLKILLKATCTGISADGVSYRDESGQEHTVPAGTVLLAAGMKADISGAERYMNCGKRFYTIGDCGQMGNLQTAIRSGFSIANTI